MHTSQLSRIGRGIRLGALLLLSLAVACAEGPNTPELPSTTPGLPSTTPPAVASVQVTPGTVALAVAEYRKLDALLRAQNGTVLSGRPVQWRSSDEAVARVDESGNLTALSEGVATITATSEGKQGEARVEVGPPPAPPAVAWVQVSGGNVELEPGEMRRLGVVLRAADGTELHGRPVSWSSSDTTVIQVRPDGNLLGIRGGIVTITATSEGKSGTALAFIPDWLRYDLHSVDGEGLPATIRVQSEITEQTEHSMVVRERRTRLKAGRVWFSTVDGGYRQLYDLETWERTLTRFNDGTVIATQEAMVDQRTLRDDGIGDLYDMWTGERIYRSVVFEGHTFRPQRLLDRGRAIQQPLPGEGDQVHNLVYRK